MFYFNDILQNWNRDCQSNGESWTIRRSIVVAAIGQWRLRLSAWRCRRLSACVRAHGVSVSLLVSGLTVSPSLCLCQGSRCRRLSACVRAHGVAVSLLVSGLTVDILNTFCGVFVVRYVKLMLRIFELWVFLFCLSPKCNLSETFTRYGHYTGEVEDIIISRLAVVS